MKLITKKLFTVLSLLGISAAAMAFPPPQPIPAYANVKNALPVAVKWVAGTIVLGGPNPIAAHTQVELKGSGSTFYPTGTLTLTAADQRGSCVLGGVGGGSPSVLSSQGKIKCTIGAGGLIQVD